MLHTITAFIDPVSEKEISGYVEEVYRDIFASEIRLMINGHKYKFKEPNVIRAHGNSVVFLYGDVHAKDVSDEQMFEELRKEQFRETISSTMRRMAPGNTFTIRFVIGEKK